MPLGVAREEFGNGAKILLPFPARPERFAGAEGWMLELAARALSCSPAADAVAELLLLQVSDQALELSACGEASNNVHRAPRAAAWRTFSKRLL